MAICRPILEIGRWCTGQSLSPQTDDFWPEYLSRTIAKAQDQPRSSPGVAQDQSVRALLPGWVGGWVAKEALVFGYKMMIAKVALERTPWRSWSTLFGFGHSPRDGKAPTGNFRTPCIVVSPRARAITRLNHFIHSAARSPNIDEATRAAGIANWVRPLENQDGWANQMYYFRIRKWKKTGNDHWN